MKGREGAIAGALAVAAMLGGPVGLAGAATGRDGAATGPAPAPTDTSGWSPPARLSACPSAGTPLLAFPSDSPSHGTGPGAVIWSASRHCPGGEGARVAAIGDGDVPVGEAIPRTAAGRRLALGGGLSLGRAPHGQVVIAGGRLAGGAGEELIEGSARGPFSLLGSPVGLLAPVALASGYLGDVALLAPAPQALGLPELRLEVERYFAHGLARGTGVSRLGGSSLQALTVAMDYRSDALGVWQQGGSIYARDLPASGEAHPLQRLASVAHRVRIAALISDDNRAIVAWSEQRGGETLVYLDISALGVRFGAPRLIERFRNPDGLQAPPASPTLIRLSSEGVMMAWAASAQGRWVVRVAAIDLQGPQAPSTLVAADGGDALLAALAPGPNGEALALWTEPQALGQGAVDLARQAIFAARGVDGSPGRVIFGAPEQLAPPASIGEPSVAFDPDSDRAVTVWRGEGGSIAYAIRAAPGP